MLDKHNFYFNCDSYNTNCDSNNTNHFRQELETYKNDFGNADTKLISNLVSAFPKSFL